LSSGEHLGGLGLLDGGGAHDAADQGGEEGGRGGFAADVAEDDGGAVGAVVDEVVEVAADGAGGKKADGHLGMGMLGAVGAAGGAGPRGPWRCRAPVGLLAADGLVEAGIFNGDGDLRGEGGEHALVLFIEEAGAGVLEVEDADDAALVKEGHDQLGAGLRVHGQIARVLADIGDIDGTPLADRRADQAAGDGMRRMGAWE
jgi:hypothetical protein